MEETKNRSSPIEPVRAILRRIGAALGGNSDELRDALANNAALQAALDWKVSQDNIREAIAEAHWRDAEALRRVINELVVPALNKLEAEGHPWANEVRKEVEQNYRDVVDEDVIETTAREEEHRLF